MIKAVVVFDLDGTVADSLGVIAELVNECFEREGVIGVFEPRHVGPPLEQMIEQAASMSPIQLAGCVRRFRERYDTLASSAPLFEGAFEAIERLSQKSEVWLATNKRRAPTESILSACGLAAYFNERVLCADDQGGLSKADMLRSIKRCRPEAWLAMVGDMQSDHDAAAEAEFDVFALACWGAASPIKESSKLAVVQSGSFAELDSFVTEAIGRME